VAHFNASLGTPIELLPTWPKRPQEQSKPALERLPEPRSGLISAVIATADRIRTALRDAGGRLHAEQLAQVVPDDDAWLRKLAVMHLREYGELSSEGSDPHLVLCLKRREA
jgi:hypothetical protein